MSVAPFIISCLGRFGARPLSLVSPIVEQRVALRTRFCRVRAAGLDTARSSLFRLIRQERHAIQTPMKLSTALPFSSHVAVASLTLIKGAM